MAGVQPALVQVHSIGWALSTDAAMVRQTQQQKLQLEFLAELRAKAASQGPEDSSKGAASSRLRKALIYLRLSQLKPPIEEFTTKSQILLATPLLWLYHLSM